MNEKRIHTDTKGSSKIEFETEQTTLYVPTNSVTALLNDALFIIRADEMRVASVTIERTLTLVEETMREGTWT